MITITIIGSGNVAQHLIQAITKAVGLDLIQVFARNKVSVSHLISNDKIISEIDAFKTADLYIIAVTDTAIREVSSHFPFQGKLVAHTSGSIAIEDLSNTNKKAVFYPLQTFSKNKTIDFKEVPICIEATNDEDFAVIKEVAQLISNSVYEINSAQRKALHVAAVFVNNFTNHLYQLGNEICKKNQVSFEILKPLIEETANKIKTLSPKQSQTGPAKRGDTQTINAHLNFLSDDNQKEIYRLLTKSILDNGKKL